MMLRHKFGYLIMAVLTVAVVWALLDRVTDKNAEQSAQLTKQSSQLGKQREDIDDLKKANEAYVDQLEDNDIEPIIEPDEATEPVAPDEPGDTTAEISQGDLALAFQACVAAGDCVYPISPAEAVDAVTTYCNARNECRGARGKRGPRGPSPSFETTLAAVEELCDGSCEGRDGETPTQEELALLVAQRLEVICDGSCEGRDGADSTVPGPQGASIQRTDCQPDGTWLFTYTDGRTTTSPGPCKAAPAKDGQDGTDGTDGTDGKDAPQPTGFTCESEGPPITIRLTYSGGLTFTAECGTAQPTEPPPETN